MTPERELSLLPPLFYNSCYIFIYILYTKYNNSYSEKKERKKKKKKNFHLEEREKNKGEGKQRVDVVNIKNNRSS